MSCDKLILMRRRFAARALEAGEIEQPRTPEERKPVFGADLGKERSNFISLFEKALAEKAQLKAWIEDLSSKSKTTVREGLCLALYRHQLSYREPLLPDGTLLTGEALWEYWHDRPAEVHQHGRIETEILSYLRSPDALYDRAVRRKAATIELVKRDPLVFMACYPVIEEMLGKLRKKSGRGAPVTRRRLMAVRALQLQIDNDWTLKQITLKVCNCTKLEHDEFCEQQVRQSIIRLKRLFRKCGVEHFVLSTP